MEISGHHIRRSIQLVGGAVVLIVLLVTTVYWQPLKESKEQKSNVSSGQLPQVASVPKQAPATQLNKPAPQPAALVYPIADFLPRITKKFYGTYVTPQNSPVQPERFTGYHTGVDVEYTDVTADVPVVAIAPGTVVVSEYASGYGGVMMIRHTIRGKQYLVLYGHLRPSSMLRVGTTVAMSQRIAVLGTGYSSETDGERRNLHFDILKGSTINIKGYVPTLAELHAGWYDPLVFFKDNM
jgi:murein DD-endopeptidase MepM/ murein hydrolase activator NlpD